MTVSLQMLCLIFCMSYLICVIWVKPESHPVFEIPQINTYVYVCVWVFAWLSYVCVCAQVHADKSVSADVCTNNQRSQLYVSNPATTYGWCLCAVAMVSGSLQERACPAEERSIAPPGGQPAEGQHRWLRPDRSAALLLPAGHQTGR